MSLNEKIVSHCKSRGIYNIGFIKCREFNELHDYYQKKKENGLENEFEEQDIDIRINPKHYMENGKTIISFAFPYLHDVKYKDTGFSLYTRGEDYHNVVHKYLKEVCEIIESYGGKALAFTDSNTLPERYIAYLAGIGFVGKNNMIITKEHGSYVFLGEIITDINIAYDDIRSYKEISEFKECGDCDICYKECPTKSINKFKKNSNICMSYITQKKEIDDKFLKIMNGRIFGCDSCQLECPYNIDVEYSLIEEFKPKDFMDNPSTNQMIKINNGEFKATFKGTSCGWRGKNIIVRNAMIKKVLHENEDISDVESSSEYVRIYKNRLLNINKL
ncbi:tRNA epoxyqueuosine(34) reductase QueG [uncultured Clostridium sp.]|jgi:epoxyqueuosine reductase|uniref:tRNA epoxyqueuosine(34) reductase QueG n=1 Tax=uncultured Clostridium sp. TaxID=59620 RepID=UPI002628AF25|nr:tRNA epoxyqueuosine(34) reductase QueG [uncultured Clostridium sp.]